MMGWRESLVLIGLVCSLPAGAAAQACADGRIATGGYCCWPGQTFDPGLNRCAGPPICPAGYAGAGSECVRNTPPASAPRGGTAWYEGLGDAASTTYVHRRDAGLQAGGAVLFFAPYLATVLTHYFLGTSTTYSGGYYGGYSSTAPVWPLTFIPVFHNLAMIGNSGGGAAVAMWIVGFLSAALEIGGLAALIVGEIGHEEPVTAPRLSFVPSAPGADVGASWVLSF